MIYYIDPIGGSDENDGSRPEAPRASYQDIDVKPGDSILFRRGIVIRDCLTRKPGTPEAPVIYGSYGEGENPVFCGSVDVSSPNDWEEISENVWQYKKELPSEACNFIFDNGRTGGTLRWEKRYLSKQGDWFDSRMGCRESHKADGGDGYPDYVVLFSRGNPGKVYSHIECAVWGSRKLSQNVSCTTVQDLSFYGSGVHAMAGGAHHMTVRRCSFAYIGGAVWNRQLQIRFGNGIEFWNEGEDILIEDCYFNNIYDSCITQQGSAECKPAKNIIMRRNLFANYGMGAYEGRDRMLVNCEFTDNLCVCAGGGFTGFGDTVPRHSEIYPQPMGHHLFMWRIGAASEGGSFRVSGNTFHDATGAAVYAIISEDADAQMQLSDNTYFTTNKDLLNLRADKSWKPEEFAAMNEPGSVYKETDIAAAANAWFARTGAGRMGMPLITDPLPAPYYFDSTTDKDPLSYKVGEDMCFRVQLMHGDEKASCSKLRCEITGEDGYHEIFFRDGADGFVEVHASSKVPGYVMLSVVACDEKENWLPDYDFYVGSVCADFDRVIKDSAKEPADFDAFWERIIKEELDPIKPELLSQTYFNCGNGTDDVFDIKVACPGPAPVSGYLRMPKNAKPGTLPIILSTMGYDVSSAPISGPEQSIHLCINQHGDENGHRREYYEHLNEVKYKNFGFVREENQNPNTVYFKYMILRALQALRYCKTIPAWDGKNITVMGGSMGAFQAVSAAAWDRDVTKLIAGIPWMCDLRGIEDGRLRGWRPEPDHGLDYYDTAAQGRRVQCVTVIDAGLGDTICPPSGVTSLYHNIAGKATLRMMQNRTHGYVPPKPQVSTVTKG